LEPHRKTAVKTKDSNAFLHSTKKETNLDVVVLFH